MATLQTVSSEALNKQVLPTTVGSLMLHDGTLMFFYPFHSSKMIIGLQIMYLDVKAFPLSVSSKSDFSSKYI